MLDRLVGGPGFGWRMRQLGRRVALGLIALALILTGFVFVMIALYQGFLIIAPPAAAALAVAALTLGAGGAVVALLVVNRPPPPPPPAAPAPSLLGNAASLSSLIPMAALSRAARGRPLLILGAATVAGLLTAWGTRRREPY